MLDRNSITHVQVEKVSENGRYQGILLRVILIYGTPHKFVNLISFYNSQILTIIKFELYMLTVTRVMNFNNDD